MQRLHFSTGGQHKGSPPRHADSSRLLQRAAPTTQTSAGLITCAAAKLTLFSRPSTAQGTNATARQTAMMTGVYTLAKRVTSVSIDDCCSAAASTRRDMRAMALAPAGAVVCT